MKSIWVAFALSAFYIFSTVGLHANPIAWSELPDPSAQNFEDPFEGLNFEQLTKLRSVTQLDERLTFTDIQETERHTLEARRNELIANLVDEGIDAAALIARRWEIAERRSLSYTAVNPEVASKDITIQGFMFPGPPTEDGLPTAYLVSDVGLCSHYPPPPPNKLVRMILSDDQKIEGFYVPVEVSGRLEPVVSRVETFLMDGPRILDSSVTLVADNLTLIAPKLRGRATKVQQGGSQLNISKALDAAK